MSRRARRVPLAESCLIGREKLRADRASDALRESVLQREDPREWLFETPGPSSLARFDLQQPNGDPHRPFRDLDAPVDDAGHLQIAADRKRITHGIVMSADRRQRTDHEGANIREDGDQRIRDSQPEGLVSLATQTKKGEYRDGRAWIAVPTASDPRCESVAAPRHRLDAAPIQLPASEKRSLTGGKGLRKGVSIFSYSDEEGRYSYYRYGSSGVSVRSGSAVSRGVIDKRRASPALDLGDCDVFMGLAVAYKGWFGDKVDAHLAEATGAGSISTATPAMEVEETSAKARVIVMRAGGTVGTVTVDWAISNGTPTAGLDYVDGAGTLTFGPGEILRNVEIPLVNDTVYAGSRYFEFVLSSPAGVTIDSDRTRITIEEDDPKPIVGVRSPVTTMEEGEGAGEVAFIVELSSAARVPVEGTWRSDRKFVFAPGETRKDFAVAFEGDAIPGEDFDITGWVKWLTNGVEGSSATVAIVDDDEAFISILDASLSESAGSHQAAGHPRQ
jgi:hypothetical protein